MEYLINYFQIVFNTTIIVLPIGIIVFILLKKNFIKIGDKQKETNIINIIKKLFVFASMIILSFLILKVSSPRLFHKRIFNNNEAFINANLITDKNQIPDSIESIFLNKSFDFLFNRYGEEIYYDDFKLDKFDTIEQTLCLHFLLNPELTDSMKLELREKIKTTQDLKKYLKN